MLDGFQGDLALLAADLNIGLRDGCHNQAVPAGSCGLRDFLNEGNKVAKRSGGQPLLLIEFSCIGHQLIHQHQAGSAGVKQVFQRFGAGSNPFFVRLFHKIIELGIACRLRKLGRHLPPQCVDADAGEILRPLRFRRVQGRSDQHGDICFWDGCDFRPLQNRLDVRDFVNGNLARSI